MQESVFLKVVAALLVLAVFYGIAITVLLLTLDTPSDALVTRMISSFGTIFSGVLGFCTGYLAGNRNGKNGANGTH